MGEARAPGGACAAELGKGGSVFAGDTERTSVRVCPHGLARGQTRLSSSSVTAAYPSTPGQTGALSRRTRVLREHLESVQHLSPILVGTEQPHARAHPAGGRLALAPRGSDLVSFGPPALAEHPFTFSERVRPRFRFVVTANDVRTCPRWRLELPTVWPRLTRRLP